jgi:nucleoside-diphosphate-sugar epimerase
MELLVLGGTRFVGRHAVGAALERGHRVTLVHRSPTELFPQAEHVLLDRSTGPDALAPLAGRTFDGLLDVCGYVPRVVRESSTALAGRVGNACFVSSVSAYAPGSEQHPAEPAAAALWPVGDLRAEGAGEEVTNESYGPLKVACEEEFVEAFPRAAVVRPTYIVGPDDYTDRFGYWVRRMAEGGEVLAADPADAPMQLIDARDLGAFMVRLLEDGTAGPFDGVGPSMDFTVADMLAACARAADRSDDVVVGVDRAWLAERGVEAGYHLPLLDDASEAYAFVRDPAPSVAAGLQLRAVEETARDALAWDRARGLPEMKDRVTHEQEAELIAQWKAR